MLSKLSIDPKSFDVVDLMEASPNAVPSTGYMRKYERATRSIVVRKPFSTPFAVGLEFPL
jgi:hypothetical protein